MRFTLFGKLNTAIIAAFLMIGLAAGALLIPLHRNLLSRENARAVDVIEFLASRDSKHLGSSLVGNELSDIRKTVQTWLTMDPVMAVTVFSPDRVPVVHIARNDHQGLRPDLGIGSDKARIESRPLEHSDLSALVIEAPVISADRLEGFVQIIYSITEANQSFHRFAVACLGFLAVALAGVLLILNRALAGFVVTPIRRLTHGMDQMLNRGSSTAVPLRSNDEIGDLTRAFNRMGSKLTAAIEALKRQIHERRQTEKILDSTQEDSLNTEALFRSIFQIHPDAICLINLADRTFVDVNQGFEMSSGYSRAEILGRKADDLGTWPFPGERQRLWDLLEHHQRAENVEINFVMKDGRAMTNLVSAVIIELSGQSHLLVVARDIQDRKQMEQALRMSEERFRLAFDNAFSGRAIMRPDGQFLQVNSALCAMLKMTAGELKQRAIQDVTRENARQDTIRKIKVMVENSSASLHLETPLVSGQGSDVWAEINAVLARNQEGEPLYLIADIEDITLMRANKQRLRKYKRIVETSPDLISLVNRDYIFEAVNQSYLAVHSTTLGEVIGYTIPQVIGDEVFLEAVRPLLDQAFNGEVVRYQREFTYGAQGKRWYDVAYYPFLDENGAITGVVTHQKDITETRLMEQRLIQSQKMEAIGTLAGGIAHDFNNILSGIFGYSQLARIHIETPSKASAHLDQVFKGAQRAAELVQQILTFSRQSEQQKRPLALYLVIKEALKLLRPSLPSYIEIREAIESKTMVLADPTRMHQVIMNLCTNAYHAMGSTGGVLTVGLDDISLTARTRPADLYLPPGGYVRLSVSDTGHGMDKEILEKVFDPYFTTKEVGRGTGLGLALVNGIVQDHRGQVRAYSSPGQGARFDVYLPVTDPAVTSRESDPGSSSLAGGSENILVVDDEESIRHLTRDILEEFGYTVHTAVNGREAWDLFKREPERFDLILTDMTMPGMTGDELAERVLDRYPDIPVILCTGYSEKINDARAAEIGIRRLLQKPVEADRLAAMIRKELDLGRSLDSAREV